MSDLYYRNRRLLVLTIALIIVAGSAAYDSLPRLEDPELVARNSIVTTRVPGGDAERVESLVTEKIEDELFDIEEIKTLESTSRAGISIIEVELNDEVTDTNEVWSRIRDKLDDVEPELPADALEPELEETDVRGYTMIAALTWQRDDAPSYAVLRRLAEGLEDRFRGIHGTENVELFGEPDEEVTVEVDHARLAAMGLTVDDVAAQIGRSDSKVSAGLMWNSLAGDVLIEVEGELDSLDRIRRTPVSYGSDGQFVQLSDIASIEKGIRRPSTDLALVAGRPAVTVAAFVKSDYRVDRWAHIARAEVAQFANQLPTGVGLEVVFDQSRYTEQRLDNLLSNLALGAAAVVVVLLLMMGWRSALIVSLSLPLSSLMVLAGMNFLDIPLHQMSVTGLIIVWLGIGAVVWISSWLFSNGNGSFGLHAGIIGWMLVMLSWLVLVTRLAGRDFFLNGSRWFSNLVGFTVVVAVPIVMFGAVPAIRNGLFAAAAATSDMQLIAIHVLRLLAIGAVVKFWQGQLPRHFVLLGAVPDFLFALSAVALLIFAGNGALSSSTLLIWHVVGAAVFLGAGISMFFSVPSPFRLFHKGVDASLVFKFPMVLAPNLTVPLFTIAHLFAITKYAIGS